MRYICSVAALQDKCDKAYMGMFFLAACMLQYKALTQHSATWKIALPAFALPEKHAALSYLGKSALPAFALPERHAEHAAEHPPDPHPVLDMTHATAHQTLPRCSARTGMRGPPSGRLPRPGMCKCVDTSDTDTSVWCVCNVTHGCVSAMTLLTQILLYGVSAM